MKTNNLNLKKQFESFNNVDDFIYYSYEDEEPVYFDVNDKKLNGFNVLLLCSKIKYNLEHGFALKITKQDKIVLDNNFDTSPDGLNKECKLMAKDLKQELRFSGDSFKIRVTLDDLLKLGYKSKQRPDGWLCIDLTPDYLKYSIYILYKNNIYNILHYMTAYID